MNIISLVSMGSNVGGCGSGGGGGIGSDVVVGVGFNCWVVSLAIKAARVGQEVVVVVVK